jgi:hypothetical protein
MAHLTPEQLVPLRAQYSSLPDLVAGVASSLQLIEPLVRYCKKQKKEACC